jgi:EpsI family protein
VAWRFFDRRVGEPWFDPRRLQAEGVPADPERRAWRSAGLIGFLAAAPVLWSTAIAAAGRQEVPERIFLPDVPGWTRVEAAGGRPWQPHFAGADHLATGHYRNRAGQEVTVAVAWFARQEEGRELIGFGQGAVGPESGWAWTADAPAPQQGRAERLASHGELREVVTFYRVGDIVTGSMMRLKLETMKVRLIGGAQRAAAVMVSAAAPSTGSSPRPAIDSFLASAGSIEDFAERAAGAR